MSTLPILLKDPKILLIGGGTVACQKARVLQDNGIDFRLLAREFSPGFDTMGLAEVMVTKSVEASDLRPFNIIIDATGSSFVAKLLIKVKEQRFVLLNIVDDPTNCDFYFASLLNYGKLKISVSTDGASPTVGQVVRDRIKEIIPKNIAALVDEKAHERNQSIIDVEKTRQQTLLRLAQVDLVGCGPGDVDLLTLQACRCIEQAEVVLYDHLIPQQILDLIPKRVERVYVGKQKHAHSMKQEEINQLTLEYAKKGRWVARLKSGDPYIFGRGAEEAMFLAEHGVRVRVVAGISSAVAAPASAGIPLTARGYATNVSIVSAHLAGSYLNTNWLPLLKIPNHTIVVLMGLSFAREIAEKALKTGLSDAIPVAIICNATRQSQRTIITTLGKLSEDSKQAENPAVLVFGDVVKLHDVLPHSG